MKCVETKPLLRSPFLGKKGFPVSALDLTWSAGALTSEYCTELSKVIVNTRIGGEFWRPACPLPGGAVDVIALSSDLESMRRCWRQVLASYSAKKLLVVLPNQRGLAPFAAEITASGSVVVVEGNPHAILDIATSVHADGPCDLSVLAGLAGRPVYYHQGGSIVEAHRDYFQAWVCEGTIYKNPFTGEKASCAHTVELLRDWKRTFDRNRSIAVCTGVSFWKRQEIAQLLHTGQAAVRFSHRGSVCLRAAVKQGGAIATWTTRIPKGLPAEAASKNVKIQSVEDGFIRSAGLGSGFTPPASIIVDRQGIYYDPSQPSDLEEIIAETEFTTTIIQRAQKLIALLVSSAISKYGAGGSAPRIASKPGQRIILVPGQVADDVSLKFGTKGLIRNNKALLATVRARNPDAFILYRPHPDVTAGYRKGYIEDPVRLGLADQVASDGTIATLFEKVDEVHTMTSLAGFEALLRGRIVETHGQPFYAGWGLTKDHLPLERRRRRITIEELVAATLILYPLYIDPRTTLPCGPEMVIARLQQAELWSPSLLMRLRRMQGQVSKAWWQARPIRDFVNA